jgi:hypothetical protein
LNLPTPFTAVMQKKAESLNFCMGIVESAHDTVLRRITVAVLKKENFTAGKKIWNHFLTWKKGWNGLMKMPVTFLLMQ